MTAKDRESIDAQRQAQEAPAPAAPRPPKLSGYATSGGIKCPECGCTDSHVYYSRRRPDFVRRVRQCSLCGRKFATQERHAWAD